MAHFILVGSMPSKTNTETALSSAAFYDDFWEGYGHSPADDDERMRIEFVASVMRSVIGRSDLNILDFGCGRGWMAPFLSPFGSVVGVDYSPKGIRFAQEHY